VVAERLVDHHNDYGSRVIIICANPHHPEVFERMRKFTVLDQNSETRILTTVQKSEHQVV
jgi:hypothetical protein